MTTFSKADRFLFNIAQGGTYESEYDGRVYTYCRYCDLDTEQHECDACCPTNEAKTLLGEDKYTQMLQAQEKREKERAGKTYSGPNRGVCPHCDKEVNNLNQHVTYNGKCIAKRLLSGNIRVVACLSEDDRGEIAMIKDEYHNQFPDNVNVNGVLKMSSNKGPGPFYIAKEGVVKHRYEDLSYPLSYFVKIETDCTIAFA